VSLASVKTVSREILRMAFRVQVIILVKKFVRDFHEEVKIRVAFAKEHFPVHISIFPIRA
jgi:hypothetical protein